MGKYKMIRCKTPEDVLVVKNRRDVDQFQHLPSTCGHGHRIVYGDVWFARPKKK